MRYPHTPPRWAEAMTSASAKGLIKEFVAFGKAESERNDRYLHWDEFRHRASSKSPLSPEEQWAAIRFSRSTRSQQIPLSDSKGKHFTFSVTQRAFEDLHEIDMHCGGSMAVAGEGALREDTRDRYYVTSIFEEALTSSMLEGAVVTRSEAREMIRNHRPPANSHERMVMNNYHTMRLLSEWKEQELTPDLILRIHREITAGTLDHEADEGRFRRTEDEVRVVDDESGETFHTPPPAEQLAQRIEECCRFANERGMHGFLHPVIRSILLHFWVAYDHPFVDGNGRTARALFYWSMLRHGFWLAEFFSISHEILKAPKKYYRAFLYTETDENDLNYFLLHQLTVIKNSIAALKEYVGRKQRELDDMSRLLGPEAGFNHRQLALLKHAVKHPNASYTVAGHQTSHGIAYQTAMNDLAALQRQGLFGRVKSGKAFIFTPAQDLTKLLGKARATPRER
jgi:Fic family protein